MIVQKSDEVVPIVIVTIIKMVPLVTWNNLERFCELL